MEARTRDILFGTGRTDLSGVFSRDGWGNGPTEKADNVIEELLGSAKRIGLITNGQAAAGGAPAGSAAEEAGAAVRSLAGGGGVAAGATAAQAGQQYANPVYGGLFAQHLAQTQGFVPPVEPPSGHVLGLVGDAATAAPGGQAAKVADDAGSAINAAAGDVARDVAALEQRLVESFKRLAQLPDDAKVPALARAVDATAAAGHGGDAFDVLGQALATRPVDAAASALDDSVAVALRAAPVVGDAAQVAAPYVDDVVNVAAPVVDDVVKVAAPVVDNVAKVAAPVVDDVVRAAVPRVVEAALPQVVSGASSATRALLLGSDDALRGLMPFAAGVDDTLRLLARF